MATVKLALLLVLSMAWNEGDSATRNRQQRQAIFDPTDLEAVWPLSASAPIPQPQPLAPIVSGVGCGVQAPGFQPNLNTRVINGNEAKPHSWPWMITLLIRIGRDEMVCGGSLLRVKENVEATDIVVTAAHCVVREETMANNPQALSPSAFTIIAGNHHYENQEKYEQVRQGASVRFHPGFKMNSFTGGNNDVAVIKLNSPIKFNEAIRPACLPQKGAPIPSGQLCVASGWGRNHSRNEMDYPVALQQLVLPVHPAATCSRSWPGAYKEDQMICAGSLQAQSGVCHGDSGGMLACKQSDGRWVQYGATSWGVAGICLEPNKPALFARLSTYVDWIAQAAQQMTSL